MTTPSKIFISYARADGTTLALNLQKKLTDLGFSAWLDTRDMTGGDDWFAQIKKAIDEAEYVVLIATPAALASENVRDEWRYARKIGVRVYPIIYPEAPIDFNQLPHHIRKRHFYHSDKTWDSFIAHLRAPYEREPVPFMAESLPAHFVNRPQIEAQLLKHLLSDDRHQSVAITTAFKGSGGFGKTTMAQAICHHDAVYDTFLNGILWVTLGENPDVLLALKKLYKALTGKDGSFSDTEEGGRMLGDQLADKDCLIVIDDVWNIAHLRPFLVGGERCARLITTRDVDIAIKAKAKTTDVDEMRPDEARALLRSGIDGLSDTILDALTKRLGYWALMLEIANGMMHTRQLATDGTWDDAHAYIIKLLDKRGVIGIRTDDDNQRKQGADGVLSVSLELLKSDEETQVCQLGIFKDDQDVPVSSVMALWGADDFDTEDLLTKFARLSLIKYRSSTASIRLHDVVREYFLTKLADVVAVHDQLLRGYGDPYALPDPYAWRFYAYHLMGANRLGELRPLLTAYRWLDAKLRHTDTNALIDDCDVWMNQGKVAKSVGTGYIPSTNEDAQKRVRTIGTGESVRTAFLPSTFKDEPIRLIRSAISNAAHVLDTDDNALAHQLAGRLMHHYTKVDEIRTFLDVVMQTPNNLFPLDPTSDYDIMNPAGGMMLRTMKHENRVNGAIQLRDGRILSWSSDNTLRLWGADGTPIKPATGHTEVVRGALELSDGRILSWAGSDFRSKDNMLRLWGADGAPVATLTGHTNTVLGALELSDGRILSWAGSDLFSQDNTLRLWGADGTPLATLTGHTQAVLGALALSDGRILSWSWDNTLRLWGADGSPVATLTGHTKAVNGALALADGRILSWSRDKTLRLWGADGTPVATLTGHTDTVNGALELSDGRILSWSDDKTLRLWGADGSPVATLTGHTERMNGALALSDGRILSWAGSDFRSQDNTLRLWGADGTPVATLTGHTKAVNGALELSDGRILSWAGSDFRSQDNTLRLWGADGSPVATLTGHTDWVNGALELSDGRILSWAGSDFGSQDNTLRLWGADGTPLATLTGHTKPVNGALALRDGRILSWSVDSTLRLWGADGTPVATLTGHTDRVNGALELRDGRILSWSMDIFGEHPQIRLWDSDGTPIDMLEQGYNEGDRAIIAEWAKKHGYTLADFYPPENDEDPLMAGGRVEIKGTDLIIVHPQTGATVHTFYGDAPFSGGVVVLDGGRVLVAGDSVGRLLFLRWVGEDGK